MAPRLPLPVRFVVQAALWSLLLLAVLRSPPVERRLLEPLVAAENRLAARLGGTSPRAIRADLSCSGADAIALLLGAILAFPAPVRTRLARCVQGAAMLSLLNVARLGSLARVASEPAAFNFVHVYVWPLLLVAAAAGMFLIWARPQPEGRARADPAAPGLPARPLLGFAAAGAVLLGAFVLLEPGLEGSTVVERIGAAMAHSTAGLLRVAGVEARAGGNTLLTARGGLRVTPECILTPLLPLYLAAVLAATSIGPARRALLAAAALPLFYLLGVLRLAALAAPTELGSASFLVHAFFQLAAGVFLVVAAAWHATGGAAAAAGRALKGLAAGALAAAAGSGIWHGLAWQAAAIVHRVVFGGEALRPLAGTQGAIALLPVFQLALLTAGWVAAGRRAARLAAGAVLLLVAQAFLLAALGEMVRAGAEPDVRVVRAAALVLPALLFALLRPPPAAGAAGRYRSFWNDVGAEFPDLGGAASTAHYQASEQRLLGELVPDLRKQHLLKTDLWDEAKNTRILAWAAGQGAVVFGIDIAESTARAAGAAFPAGVLHAAVADVRQLPFSDGSFDLIYSMGTIEHFPDPERAVAEMHRVLRRGGRAIVGVPNRLDPFLRPALVWCLQRLGLYAYGAERSFTRRALRRMLEDQGLAVEVESGILFIPGWLRMADLLAHVRWPALCRLTAPVVRVFARLEDRVPALRRHGYLLATLARKP